mmetsp:Transcript_18013/g.55146  ORF Transcript_18013/g.55146 Transcript_18013/m.55146 type:complete len:206 (-) Transcript_18013:1436-2053(-)
MAKNARAPSGTVVGPGRGRGGHVRPIAEGRGRLSERGRTGHQPASVELRQSQPRGRVAAGCVGGALGRRVPPRGSRGRRRGAHAQGGSHKIPPRRRHAGPLPHAVARRGRRQASQRPAAGEPGGLREGQGATAHLGRSNRATLQDHGPRSGPERRAHAHDPGRAAEASLPVSPRGLHPPFHGGAASPPGRSRRNQHCRYANHLRP